jgi:hypothetical protein
LARLFISHSSRNNDKAIEIRDWLAKNGWDDVFLDLDPERGIVAGERWKDALQKAAQRCEIVLALISAEWLASPWCRAEINTARLMGKKIIVAQIGIDKAQVPPDLSDEQWIDLTGDSDAYTRLREGLRRGGLDPSSFPFEAGRPPYPGFAFSRRTTPPFSSGATRRSYVASTRSAVSSVLAPTACWSSWARQVPANRRSSARDFGHASSATTELGCRCRLYDPSAR